MSAEKADRTEERRGVQDELKALDERVKLDDRFAFKDFEKEAPEELKSIRETIAEAKKDRKLKREVGRYEKDAKDLEALISERRTLAGKLAKIRGAGPVERTLRERRRARLEGRNAPAAGTATRFQDMDDDALISRYRELSGE